MPTLNQHLFTIKNTADKGKSSRIKGYSDRQITHFINVESRFLMTKSMEKLTEVPASWQQDLGCWPLECVDEADCPGCFKWNRNIKKAVFPDICEIKDNMGMCFFGLIDKKTSIYLSASISAELDRHAQFQPKYMAMMVGSNTVYIYKGAEKLKVVNIRGVFKDPTLVTFYNEQGVAYCFDPNKSEYPVPQDEVTYMYQAINQKYIIPFATAPKDVVNNEQKAALV